MSKFYMWIVTSSWMPMRLRLWAAERMVNREIANRVTKFEDYN